MRKLKNITFKSAAIICGVAVLAVAAFIFAYVFFRGFGSIEASFLTDRPRGIPLGSEGGIFPAITGTMYMGALTGLLAGFVALLTAIFLVFYCSKKLLGGLISSSLYFLAGIPSILFGIVGYVILIHHFGLPASVLTASITVAIMILPFISLRIIKIFKEDAAEAFNAALALGLSRHYIIWKLILPKYFINILTSITLGMAYGAGAAAPVMFTGAVILAETPTSIMQPFMALSYHLFILVSEGISLENAYASALVLMSLLLLVNIMCRVLENLREGAQWRFGKRKR